MFSAYRWTNWQNQLTKTGYSPAFKEMIGTIQEIRHHKIAAAVLAAVFLFSVAALFITLKHPAGTALTGTVASEVSGKAEVTVPDIDQTAGDSNTDPVISSAQELLLPSSAGPSESEYVPQMSAPADPDSTQHNGTG